MGDYIITPANVQPIEVDGRFPSLSRYRAGEAITAGQSVSIDATDELAWLVNITAANIDDVKGIAVNDCVAGQYIDLAESGGLALGAVGVAGDIVVASASGGGLAASGDLITTNIVSIVGHMETDTLLQIKINNTNVAKG